MAVNCLSLCCAHLHIKFEHKCEHSKILMHIENALPLIYFDYFTSRFIMHHKNKHNRYALCTKTSNGN